MQMIRSISQPLRQILKCACVCAFALAASGIPQIALSQVPAIPGQAEPFTNNTDTQTDYGNTRSSALSQSGDVSSDDYDYDNQGTGTQGMQGTQGNRLRQTPSTSASEPRQNQRTQGSEQLIQLPPYVPSEFERYVQTKVSPSPLRPGQAQERQERVRRFGSLLLTDPTLYGSTQDPLPTVPGDYVVKEGDEVVVTVWGPVDADLHLVVDRAGRISVPRVGAINVAGVRASDLQDVISRRVAVVFKNFQLAATVGQVRPMRVFVSGYARRPGSITVNGLASVLHAIMRAGGPSAAGSFRDIHLRRGGQEIAAFDLYDVVLKGDRGVDLVLHPDDVIFIGPIGTQVAMIGSVNQQAIFELKAGETLADLLRMAGGFTAVADRTKVAIERLADRTSGLVSELKLPDHYTDALGTGDIVRAFSAVVSAQPQERQNKRIHIEGEVAHPGDYVLPPGSRLSDALNIAGGLTAAAYPYGAEFTRESVRMTQQENYNRALRELETDMAKNESTFRVSSAEEVNAQNANSAANARLIERLRQVRPTGRVVLQIAPDAKTLPDMALEDGDRLSVPAAGTSVGVFGSVFSSGSFVFVPHRNTGDYLGLAGGPTRSADQDSMFVIHANGSVVSARQGASFWSSSNQFASAEVLPGDTLFVPDKLDRTTFTQDAKDWTQILYQFGLGLAGIKALGL
jgi:protein involved in polysaccharide export with SLBB domain